jgi:hypothetical protein
MITWGIEVLVRLDPPQWLLITTWRSDDHAFTEAMAHKIGRAVARVVEIPAGEQETWIDPGLTAVGITEDCT